VAESARAHSLRYDPYRYLSRGFARAVATGRLHPWCEFCYYARPRQGCRRRLDPRAAWSSGDCPFYLEVDEDDGG
jgi:hypothetical protein